VAKEWQKPKRFDRNLIVIGAGSAGLVSAYIASMVKAKVTLVEAHDMGGDCLNTGCVPSKALIKSAKVAHQAADSARFGIQSGAPVIDFPAVMRRVRDVITAIEPHDSVERFTGLGVDCVKGYARFVNPWTIEIDGARQLTAKSFIIATGATPFIPPLPGVEDSGYLTSETLWDAMADRPTAPNRLVILGGGPIGCELAQAFQRLGSKVTIVEMADRLLLKEDADAAALVTARLQAEGVTVHTAHRALRFEAGKTLVVEALGLVVDGQLENDDFLRTNMPHIYCAGDVAGRQQLTHGGSHEAWYASVNALARPFKKYRTDYRVLPRVTYTEPELATVGLTEAEARAQGLSFDVTRYDLDDLDRAIAECEAHGFVKILTAKGSDRILGATIIGQNAGEILAEVTFAMKHKMGLRKILQTIHPYPTWAEANKYAAGQFGLARKPEALLKWAERWFRWQRS
jgi:pyruvate/2-oxoglutarate dehydrogenase complex dihydrolipoamide dehydrogenase (E3) component